MSFGRHCAGMKLRIGIVGAGIGGLAAAALLGRDGHQVVLAERFANPRPIGSGLVLQPVGLAVLAALGMDDDARRLGAPILRMLGHAGLRQVLNVRYAAHAPGLAIHRASLFSLLWQAALASDVTLETGAAVVSVPRLAAGRMIMREGADALSPFDLVIDASGAGSALSPLKARALPYGAVWASVPWPGETQLPLDQLTQAYRGASNMAGVLPIGRLPNDPSQRAAVFWSLPREQLDEWPKRDLDDWKAKVAALWPEMLPFLTNLNHPDDLAIARYSHGTLRKPYAHHLAFIGDSAHRASPQLGQGANMALLDAMALTQALRLPLDEALPRYASMRHWHVRLYQAMSAAFTPMYQSKSRSLPVLRDHLLAPLAKTWPVSSLLTALVSGTLVPPLASTRWPLPPPPA